MWFERWEWKESLVGKFVFWVLSVCGGILLRM